VRLVYCGPEKWSDVGQWQVLQGCQYKSNQEEMLYGNSSLRLVYCGPEKWSDVGQWQELWGCQYKSYQEDGNPSMRLVYSFAPLDYL
jgi:mannose-1-phosphate guanylyltransferase